MTIRTYFLFTACCTHALRWLDSNAPTANTADIHDDGWSSDWYATLEPIDPSSAAPANRLLTRKNVCLKTRGSPGEYRFGWEEPRVLSKVWKMKDIPSDYAGRVHKGTLLIATVHHFNNYIWSNIGHFSSSAFATFDALDALKDHNLGWLPVNITAVVMQQASNVAKESWHRQISQLMGNSNGLETAFIQGPDLDNGIICAEQVLFYHRPNKRERHYFSSPHHAAHFQEQAIKALNLPDELRASVRKPGRILNMVIRKDAQGYNNWKAINKKTREYLAMRCWEMLEYDQTAEPLRNQAAAWARGDLSVSVHGAHFSNLVFQGPKTGVIIVQKPGVEDLDNCELGQEMGILTFKVGPEKKTLKTCMRDLVQNTNSKEVSFADDYKGGGSETVQEVLANLGTYEMESTPQENAPFNLDWERDFQPVLVKAIDDLEKIAVRGPPCNSRYRL